LAPESVDDVLEDVRRVGELVDEQVLAAEIVDAARRALDELEAATRGLDRVDVYWEWWPNPPISPGDTGWTREVIAIAGGRNVFDDREGQSVEVSLDEIEKADPDAIAVCWQGTLGPVQSAEKFARRESFESLRAVENDRVLVRPEALHGRPGPRLVEGAIDLAAHLHPDAYERPAPYASVPGAIKDRLPLGDALP
jgi:iron complex transport system substrate-binding protein